MSGACQNKIQLQLGTDRFTTVSCATCDLCRQSALTNMVGRCLLEEEAAFQTTFMTFTYANDENYGATEVIPEDQRGYGDLQRLFKRLRKADFPFRYIAALEHGRKGEKKLHFHVMFFWVSRVPELPPFGLRRMWSFWPHGFSQAEESNMATMAYVAKYLLKEQSLQEKGKPKISGSKRSQGYRDPMAKAMEKANRMEIAREAGFLTYADYKAFVKSNPDSMVKYSNHPTFGLGHSSIPDEKKPLGIMAKRLVDAGLPFDRRYKMPKGFYYSGADIKTVTYFMANFRMVDEFYRLYSAAYYKKHGRGESPIRNNPNSEDEDSFGERHVVENILYGPAFWESGWVDPDLRTQADQWEGAPLPSWIPRNKRGIAKRFKKVVYYSDARVALWQFHDGRIIAVRETKIISPKSMGAYSKDRRLTRDVVTRGFQRWPVKDRGELLALARGRKIPTRARIVRVMRHVWNSPGETECPF